MCNFLGSGWPVSRLPDMVRPVMDDSKRREKELDVRQRQQLILGIDELYSAYCEYVEASRAAMLRVTVCPEARRSIAKEVPSIPRHEFESRINSMSDNVRRDFVRRVSSGYESARLMYRDELLRRFRPAA